MDRIFVYEKFLSTRGCLTLPRGYIHVYDHTFKKLNPGVVLTLSGAIYMYMSFIVKQVYWYISQVSVYRTIGPLVLFLLQNINCVYSLESPH